MLPVQSRKGNRKSVFMAVNGDLALFVHYLPDEHVYTGQASGKAYIVTAAVEKKEEDERQRGRLAKGRLCLLFTMRADRDLWYGIQ